MKRWKRNAGRASVFKLSFCLLLFLAPQPTFGQEPTFRSQSNVVIVPALVRDVTGHVIYGLRATDFIIEDDGVGQAVQMDESAESEALSLVVAIQTGRRASREFDRIKGLNSMLAPILDQPDTRIAVLTFDNQLNLAQDFTADGAQIAECLYNLPSGDSGAAILDAVQYSVRLLNKSQEGRQKVLLLISETRDHGSHFAKIDDVVTLIGNSNTTVYALAFSPTISNILDTERGNNRDEMNTNVDLIALFAHAKAAMKSNTPRAIASQTGGEYQLFESRQRFETRMVDFTNHLHNRYLLSFEPKNPKSGLHQIRVQLKQPGAATIRTRSSYWVAAPNLK
jgi:VWFA-related protein